MPVTSSQIDLFGLENEAWNEEWKIRHSNFIPMMRERVEKYLYIERDRGRDSVCVCVRACVREKRAGGRGGL